MSNNKWAAANRNMSKYISMLRGINVGGQRKVRMDDLKSVYESLQFKNVQTYIQSGNVIFESSQGDIPVLTDTIEKGIEAGFGFPVPVTIRSRGDILKVLRGNPFKDREDQSKLHVTFLKTNPAADLVSSIDECGSNGEQLRILKREIYLYCPNGYGRSKLSNSFLEKKLAVVATTRNWKTVQALYELSK